jgi:bifunctional UDP-N-acetylglucosamine pyrophosphorylase/glucosamine-1-phosphate N-acetyltransferase
VSPGTEKEHLAMSAIALILAAGEGTRMKSDKPKVAHEILGLPMVRWVVDAAREAGCERSVAITGHRAEQVEALLGDVECVRQDQQLGTGHAVMCAQAALGDFHGSLLVLSGDTPLLRASTISGLVAMRESAGAVLTLLTATLPDPTGYGRIVRDRDGNVARIVEEKDCTPEQRAIAEVNTGTYCFDSRVLFAHLDRLTTENVQGEYYLTDMVSVFVAEGLTVSATLTDDPLETLGVNSRLQLADAAKIMQRRINHAHLLDGVTMIDPDLVWIGPHVSLGMDVELLPMTFLMGTTIIGDRAVIGPNSRLTDATVAEDVRVDTSVVVSAAVGPRACVGPVAYLRAGTVLEADSKAGSCVEIKNSTVGEGSKVPHLSYIGDASIGKNVNIGAGAITCNFDGFAKHPTAIGDGAFVGSDTMLVAPVTIGEGAITAAGSTIAHDVPEGALALERSKQVNVDGWAERRRRKNEDS